MTNEQLPLWIRWKNIGAAVIRKWGYRSQNMNKTWEWKSSQQQHMWGCMCRFYRNVWGDKSCKRTKNFLQAGLLLYLNSFQPSPLYHKKDLVSMFKGSLTILSWSMHVFFPSSHAFHVASSLLFMIFIVFTRVKHFRVWNVFVLLRLVSLSKDLFASGLKRQNRKECNVRPHHDIQHILSSDQPMAICTWIPWQHLPVKLVTLFFSAPNQRYWKYEHAEYDGLFFLSYRKKGPPCMMSTHAGLTGMIAQQEVEVRERLKSSWDRVMKEESRGCINAADVSQVLQQMLCRESHQELLHVWPFTHASNSRWVSRVHSC